MRTALPHLRAIRATGADVIEFLHRQLSADIRGLGEGEARYACLCQPKGRVIALLLVARRVDGAVVICAESLADKVAQWLSRFIFRDDVRLATEPEAPCAASAGDPESFAPLSECPDLVYGLAAATEDDAAAAAGFRARELAAGVAWLDGDTTEKFLPQMLGTEHIGALSFRKGCYPGQEIVARTHYLGKLKQRPVLALTDAPVDVSPLDTVMLVGDDGDCEAQVVDAVVDVGGTRMILVARAQEPPAVDRLVAGDTEVGVVTRWPRPAQASATT